MPGFSPSLPFPKHLGGRLDATQTPPQPPHPPPAPMYPTTSSEMTHKPFLGVFGMQASS